MTDQTVASVAESIEAALLSRVDAGDFDLVVEGGAIDLATDDWTLHLDGFPEVNGWIAIDNEPDQAAGYGEAVRASFQATEITALREANAGLDGLIASALRQSDDAISVWFAEFIEAE